MRSLIPVCHVLCSVELRVFSFIQGMSIKESFVVQVESISRNQSHSKTPWTFDFESENFFFYELKLDLIEGNLLGEM